MRTLPERLLQADFVRVYHRAVGVTLMEKTLDEDLTGQLSYLADHVVSVVLEGEQRIEMVDGGMARIQAGQGVLLRKGLYTVHDGISGSGRFRALLVFFGEEWMKEWREMGWQAVGKGKENKSVWTFSAPNYAEPFVQSLHALYAQSPELPPPVWTLKLKEWFTVLLAEQPVMFSELAQRETGPQRSLREFMQDHFDNPLTIRDYAYLTGRSESTFRREFKQRFGTTPRKWITRRRLEKASELLRDVRQDVNSIAYAIGYDNPSHFIQEFKKQFGRTPKQFQRAD